MCLQINTGYQLNKDSYTNCASLFIMLCMMRHQNILLTSLNRRPMFRDMGATLFNTRTFTGKKLKKKKKSMGRQKFLGRSTNVKEQSATSCKKFELYLKFQEKQAHLFLEAFLNVCKDLKVFVTYFHYV